MSAAYITISTKTDLKANARKIAKRKGFSLSGMVNHLLEMAIKNDSLIEDSTAVEKPTRYLLQSIKRGRKALKESKASPIFHSAKEGIEWLHK